ncbi:hypothetical protein KC331_g395 [Hortaea werneckii]|nr:hypothetical protein KC361_g8656 [Hortaea werneckii]KAI6823137.1 hypothetical protein KC342_g12237 [Hortaea werneckii]KAI7345110.1 hypothetical protein KC320_g8490 [Hortaea werneckii]KAI7554662.1 hypothetical protein KC331_g395 [Hortaea werneckii]KAI7722569.1 hypothetical protein KC353_g392 [Hortaea werneckii]
MADDHARQAINFLSREFSACDERVLIGNCKTHHCPAYVSTSKLPDAVLIHCNKSAQAHRYTSIVLDEALRHTDASRKRKTPLKILRVTLSGTKPVANTMGSDSPDIVMAGQDDEDELLGLSHMDRDDSAEPDVAGADGSTVYMEGRETKAPSA